MRLAIAVLVATTSIASGKPAPAKPARWQTLTPPTATMPAAASTGTVERDGASIYYATYGDAKNPPVILLHGGMGNSDHWVLQLPALTDAKLRVIVIDSRGQGRSTRTKAKPTYDQMADDVVAVLDKLEVTHASFVGWSDGGEIALKLGIQHADHVDKLFVMGANYDASGTKPKGQPSKTFPIYSARCRKDYAKLSKTPKDYDAHVQWLAPIWNKPMGFTKDQLKQIKAPTIIADGDHDEIIKMSQLEEMTKLIPNAKLHVFTDTSHFVLWQDPDALNKALVEFLVPTATK